MNTTERQATQLTATDLGSCCACGVRGPGVRNVIMLDKLAPIPGHGWGCFECELPPDGAVVVLCDGCMDEGREPTEACRGFPGIDGRVPIDELAGVHQHNEARHAGLPMTNRWGRG